MANNEVRERLDALIHERGEDYASVSRLLRRNPSYVQQFVKRGIPRRLSEEDRLTLAHHFSVPEEWLGAPPPARHAEPDIEWRQNQHIDDFVLIPAYDIRVSESTGQLPQAEDALGTLAFRASWVRAISPSSPNNLAVLEVDGDGMHPTLSHGDQVLVDTGQTDHPRDGIYVIRVDGALLVKRISVNPTTMRLSIKSDNQAYESWHDCDPRQIDIIGRVAWVGRRL